MMIEQDLEIVFNTRVVSDTYLMGLRSKEIAKAAKPGHFVMIRVRSGIDPLLRRPFSICGVQGDDLFHILYRVVGQGTAIMAEIKEGEKLSVLGPLGKGFEIRNSNQMPLLVAGGIGVAPLFFLAQSMKATPVQFMMGFGSVSEIIPIEEDASLSMDVFIATDDGTAGYAGPVTDLLASYLKEQGLDKDSLSIFTCGPAPMLKKVAAMALENGISCQASLEANMACGIGACQGCAIKASSDEKSSYYHVCKHGPVFWVDAIDWNSL
jgi:dihydroorotate dehydrogenase electron transfer subunit